MRRVDQRGPPYYVLNLMSAKQRDGMSARDNFNCSETGIQEGIASSVWYFLPD